MSGQDPRGAIWLPPSAAASRAHGVTVRPFEKIGRQVKRMGFDVGLRHDPGECNVTVRFTPITPKAEAACIAGGGDGQGLEVTLNYDPGQSGAEAALACIEKGIETLEQVL